MGAGRQEGWGGKTGVPLYQASYFRKGMKIAGTEIGKLGELACEWSV